MIGHGCDERPQEDCAPLFHGNGNGYGDGSGNGGGYGHGFGDGHGYGWPSTIKRYAG